MAGARLARTERQARLNGTTPRAMPGIIAAIQRLTRKLMKYCK